MKYKVGDKVRVRANKNTGKIVSINENENTVIVAFDGGMSGHSCIYDEKYLESIEEQPKNLIPLIAKEPKLTEDEKAILRNIPEKYKYIARDDWGTLYVYGNKPKKDDGVLSGYSYANLSLFRHLFQFIKQEDKEPYKIQELLEEYENLRSE